MEVQQNNYQVSGYRWIILLLFMFVTIMTQIIWITFAPIQSEAAAHYNVSENFILLLTLSFMILYIPVNFPATWALDKYGLKWGTGIGVILTGVFGLVRSFSGLNVTLLMIAQIMVAIGQPFVLNSFTKVAVNWFPEKEKTTATGLGTVSILLGIIIGMVVTPLLFQSNGIDYALRLYGIFAVISMVLYLVFVKNVPEHPPSAFAGKKAFDFGGLKELFKNRDFMVLMAMVFIGLGAFNGISSRIEDAFPLFHSQTEAAGMIGGMIVIGGIFGAGILSALSDKWHKRKIFLVLAMVVSVPMTLVLPLVGDYTEVLVLSFIFGFFLVSALPVALIYAAEITYPVTEEASNGLMLMIGQISGIVLAYLFNMTVIAIIFAIGALLSFTLTDISPEETPSTAGQPVSV